MTTRDQIVHIALGFNGTCNSQGYNGPNPFSVDLGRPKKHGAVTSSPTSTSARRSPPADAGRRRHL
jgi:hypothetical protein